ncbi:MAG TPA: hypothetical protein P5287_03450 [bacterium]|nr:hypothetical protein [bacterium]
MMAIVTIGLLCAEAFAQIPRVGAEEEANRKREQIRYRLPESALIEVEGAGVNMRTKEGTLLQPLRKPASQPVEELQNPPETKR